MTSAAHTLSPSPVRIDRQGPVAIVTLDDPGARNALSSSTMRALQDVVATLSADDAVRAVVLRAEGPAFCAGHDLKELRRHNGDADGGRAFYDALFRQCSDLMVSIVASPKPFIAEVAGVATAAGCQLVASCDLAWAGDGARFATPGVHIGLFCSTPMVALSRNVGRKHAMEMLLTGDMIDANEAMRMGLVNRVVPAADLHAAVMETAAKVASKSPLTVRIGKEAFYAQLELGLGEAYAMTARVMAENMMARDAAEGIGAFVDKRDPVWEGR